MLIILYRLSTKELKTLMQMFTEIDKKTMFYIIQNVYDKFPYCVDDRDKEIFYINFSSFKKESYDWIYEIMEENINERKERKLKESCQVKDKHNKNIIKKGIIGNKTIRE